MNTKNVIPNTSAQRIYDIVSPLWSADTSADESWTIDNPELGQCAVTALVVQDALGGVLLRSTVNGVSHYWNRITDGTEVDLTRAQFAEPVTFGDIVEREREYVLSFPITASRYRLLKDNVNSSMLRILMDIATQIPTDEKHIVFSHESDIHIHRDNTNQNLFEKFPVPEPYID
jgi:hypothetical protein